MVKPQTKKFIRQCGVGVIALGIIIPTIVVLSRAVATYSTQQMSNILTPHEVTFDIKSVSNVQLQERMRQFITKRTTQESLFRFNADTFFTELKARFDIIKTVDWKMLPPQKLHLTIIGHTPCCLANNQWVVGDGNELISLESFDAATLGNLPTITINQRWTRKKRLPSGTIAFIHAIKPQQWATYQITYHAPWNIEAVPYTSICKCRVIADEKSFFEERKFAAISSIFKDLCGDGLITKKVLQSKGIPLAFDLRMKNQVIVKLYEPIKRGKGL